MKPTVINLLTLGHRYLARSGVRANAVSSERMLGHLLGHERAALYLDRNRPVERSVRKAFCALLKRRAQRYPLQYLLGEAHFMDFRFRVNAHCLIPRPETERLVDAVRAILAERTPDGRTCLLDVGTGSGNVALSLACYLPKAEVWASDISEAALDVARANAGVLGVSGRVQFVLSDLFQQMPKRTFDGIVSNPPYLSNADMAVLDGEVAFEPRQALYGGVKGTELIEHFIASARAFLRPGGFIAFEIGRGQAGAVVRLLNQYGYRRIRLMRDYTDIFRVAQAHWMG